MDPGSYPSQCWTPYTGASRSLGGSAKRHEKAMKSQLLVLPLLCFVGYSANAFAQQAPPPTPPPKIDLSTEAPAKPVQRTYHLHEGFYLRTSVGFGYYYGSFTDNHRPNSDYSQHGGSMSLDLLIGGSPSPGLSIGGGILVDPLFGASYERNGREIGSHGGVSALIGPFIDAFPDSTKGWHLGGLIGFGGQSFQNVSTDKRERAAGFGGAAWFGYDFWVAPEWSGGPQFRVMGMSASSS